MSNVLMFFSWFFDAIWGFFTIPFPGLDMSIGAVLVGLTCFYFAFRLLALMFTTTTTPSQEDK